MRINKRTRTIAASLRRRFRPDSELAEAIRIAPAARAHGAGTPRPLPR